MEINKLQIACICILIILFFALGIVISPMMLLQQIKLFDKTNCSSMDLLTTAVCLNNQVNSFFKYNISQVGKELTLDELKESGGTCKQFSEYYIDNARNLGFNAQEIDFFGNNSKIGHAIALVYNNNLTSYCILDQQRIVGCGELKGIGGLNES